MLLRAIPLACSVVRSAHRSRQFQLTRARFLSYTREDVEKMAVAISKGNRFQLSKAITLIESTRDYSRSQGQEVLDRLLAIKSEGGNTVAGFRMGISGPPGVGKSTFIESLGMDWIKMGHKVAVIAVDPSSHLSGGAILGDKTRMSALSMHPEAFVRPCPSGCVLGGLAEHTDEVVQLMEAAGYGVILVETVGVGQSEILVTEVADMCLLLLPPAGGDELQGIKRGIVEAADLIVVNKADGDLLAPARRALSEYRNALHTARGSGRALRLVGGGHGGGGGHRGGAALPRPRDRERGPPAAARRAARGVDVA
eukprot:CAMPEP_0172178792 /NCGR_PEP_ID=MMETSP1050-20130122/16243_1 /TAXON_ID=233186 /ORGANISM="Cryptomonas curvata, Strain CCAP979/52" /LENGTH=310 /DNA_ID=CAMNT_0012851571 /DNA_START=31 /DNA_END=960 /DNA_ORIENTATION=+